MIDGIYHLYEITKLICGARAVFREAGAATARADSRDGASHRQIYDRIVRLTVAMVASYCIVVPCSAPWLAFWLYGITPGEALFRTLLGLLLSIGTVFLPIYAGESLGCLTAPAAFLRSPAGAPWMRAVGPGPTIAEHRALCIFALLVGFGAMIGIGSILILMNPTNAW